METVSKKKRGRPSVYQREYGEYGQAMKASHSIANDAQSERSKTNMAYYMDAFDLLCGLPGFKETFFKNGNHKGKCVVEQIGRMHLQNRFTEESCVEIGKAAMRFLQGGYTVRSVENWIRHGRNTNEW